MKDKYIEEEFEGVEPVGNDLHPSQNLSVGDIVKELKRRTKPPEYPWEKWKTKAHYCDCWDCREIRAQLYAVAIERNEEINCPHQDQQFKWCETHCLPYHRELEQCVGCRNNEPPIEKAKKNDYGGIHKSEIVWKGSLFSGGFATESKVPDPVPFPKIGFHFCGTCKMFLELCICERRKR